MYSTVFPDVDVSLDREATWLQKSVATAKSFTNVKLLGMSPFTSLGSLPAENWEMWQTSPAKARSQILVVSGSLAIQRPKQMADAIGFFTSLGAQDGAKGGALGIDPKNDTFKAS